MHHESDIGDTEGGASPTLRRRRRTRRPVLNGPVTAGSTLPTRWRPIRLGRRTPSLRVTWDCGLQPVTVSPTATASKHAETPLTGACRVRSCAGTTRRHRGAQRTTADRATPAAERSGAAVHVAWEAAGAPSAWSQFVNSPPRDHADGATLGRRRRTRRPVPIEPWTYAPQA